MRTMFGEAQHSILSEAGRFLVENNTLQLKTVLGDFKDGMDRHLSRLRVRLGILESHPRRDRDSLFFLDLLQDCHTIKDLAERNHQGDIKELIHCFEVVIELLRRRKIRESGRIYQRLHEIVEAVSHIIENRLHGVTTETMMMDRLRECLDEIRNGYVDD
jgi:chemotaxis protein histidine kinase CheA